MKILTDLNEPILFRTTDAEVYEATTKRGSIWLRSDQYFRNVEDSIRADLSEGINSSRLAIPLHFEFHNGPAFQIAGSGLVGQQITPHYILSLHGNSISAEQLSSFGGHTFGVKSLSRLSAEVLYRATSAITCTGYRYGPVHYQRTSLCTTPSPIGSAAIQLRESPPLYLNPINTDVLRKDPILPFIEQDEWRIAVFTDGYLNGDSNAPLKIEVDPSHFFV